MTTSQEWAEKLGLEDNGGPYEAPRTEWTAIQRYWLRHMDQNPGTNVIPKIVCRDGFEMSVQASDIHYCEPKTIRYDGAYKSWEVAFPSGPEPLLEPYLDSHEEIAGWVPTDVVNAIIEKHGGIAQ